MGEYTNWVILTTEGPASSDHCYIAEQLTCGFHQTYALNMFQALSCRLALTAIIRLIVKLVQLWSHLQQQNDYRADRIYSKAST